MDDKVELEDVAAREWELRAARERRRAASRIRPPSNEHFWLYLGVFSLVVHAVVVRAFTEPFMVHTAVVVVGALVSLVTSVGRAR